MTGHGPVVVLYGPTASGKSALALAMAERLGGTIINADSLQLYRDLEILTARPDAETLARAPHRLYGILAADDAGSAARWREAALAEIRAAHHAGRLPIVTGGTGLYLKALMEGLSPLPSANQAARLAATHRYETIGGEAFRNELAARDPVVAARLNPGDRQRLIRAWEVVEATGTPLSAWQAAPRERGHDYAFRLVGLLPDRAQLYDRIERRFDAMLDAGALSEARRFAALGLPPSLPVNKALGLPELRRHLHGELSLADARTLAQQTSRNYAKRQMTWFRNQLPAASPQAGQHDRHAVFAELSERKIDEIISFIVRTD